MRYIKTYNEKLGDKLVPPNNDEIISKLKSSDKPASVLLKECMQNNFLEGVKYIIEQEKDRLLNSELLVIEENIINCSKEIIKYLLSIPKVKINFKVNRLYIIEKYCLGLHQWEEKEFETYLRVILSKTSTDYNKEYVYFRIKSNTIIFYDKDVKKLILYKQIWQHIMKSDINSLYIKFFVKMFFKKFFKYPIESVELY